MKFELFKNLSVIKFILAFITYATKFVAPNPINIAVINPSVVDFIIKTQYESIQPETRSGMANPNMAADLLSNLMHYGCWCSKFLINTPNLGGKPIDSIDLGCRSWAQCRHCEMFSECSGEVDPDYLPYMEFNKTSSKLKIECRGMNECTTNRCLCDTEFLVRIISASVTETAGTLQLNEKNKYLSGNNTICEKMGGGLQPDGCCGNAPVWRPYNTAQKTCDDNGVLRNPALYTETVDRTDTAEITEFEEVVEVTEVTELSSDNETVEEGPTQGQVNVELVDNLGNFVGGNLVTEGTVVSK